MKKKLILLGLDCAAPELVFNKYRDQLPTLNRLIAHSNSGELISTTPPITVPAWTSMTTGKDPGELGLYGFRNRKPGEYELETTNNSAVRAERIWDRLDQEANIRSVVIGVPQTFPPRINNGIMVSGIMTPSVELDYTCPARYAETIEQVVPDYMCDVKNFRSLDKNALLREIRTMTEKRFRLMRHFIQTERWEFLMMVEIGLDRMHHIFWGEDEILLDYYKQLDREIGKTIDRLNEPVPLWIVSDHGAKTMAGGFCLNDWLIQEGYLVLKQRPQSVQPLSLDNIDWANTTAWGAGGYYGRIFLNVLNREPKGIIKRTDYQKVRDTIREKLRQPSMNTKNQIYYPEEIYRQVNGVAPDLIVYFDNLNLRSIGSVGHSQLFTSENDNGNDAANHTANGIYIISDVDQPPSLQQLQGRLPITAVFDLIRDYFQINPSARKRK